MVKMINVDITLLFKEAPQPWFPEALVRGGLGFAIKRMICLYKKTGDCGGCIVGASCLYSLMFSEVGKTRKGLQVSPYGISCAADNNRLIINFVLFEPLLNYCGHIIAILTELGKEGVGNRRYKYGVEGIADRFAPDKIYTGDEIKNFAPVIKTFDLSKQNNTSADTEHFSDGCVISFVSPTRIEKNRKLVDEIDFADVVRFSAMRYLNLERAFYSGIILFAETAKQLEAEAGLVKTDTANFEWVRKDRYSSKQRNRISMGGFMGSISFSGDISPFCELLDFASQCGIGKNTTFGCGRFTFTSK